MKSTLVIAAMATASILALSCESAHADHWLRKQACSITDLGHPTLHVQECLIDSNMSPDGHVRWIVTTPDGRRFRIENDKNDVTMWRLNGRSAEQILGGRCYDNYNVAVCVENGTF
jgi:hypothetical protein